MSESFFFQREISNVHFAADFVYVHEKKITRAKTKPGTVNSNTESSVACTKADERRETTLAQPKQFIIVPACGNMLRVFLLSSRKRNHFYFGCVHDSYGSVLTTKCHCMFPLQLRIAVKRGGKLRNWIVGGDNNMEPIKSELCIIWNLSRPNNHVLVTKTTNHKMCCNRFFWEIEKNLSIQNICQIVSLFARSFTFIGMVRVNWTLAITITYIFNNWELLLFMVAPFSFTSTIDGRLLLLLLVVAQEKKSCAIAISTPNVISNHWMRSHDTFALFYHYHTLYGIQW